MFQKTGNWLLQCKCLSILQKKKFNTSKKKKIKKKKNKTTEPPHPPKNPKQTNKQQKTDINRTIQPLFLQPH